ncbi:NAD(P)H-binding protein [Flavobacterium sp. NST-5]|uniref:NAD(P)H-binding protein n=1 Tax=Flavobacterium ichthyis TaxID=2698827 RepID=A0ABW9Z8W5_9FLAO|nr:NAD-dependent epimerase/dehydratase family protein [Flavobacterium ichthyis]NBL65017.1 NAD(P)H-binding protein [Flavobacterium ichthyis]
MPKISILGTGWLGFPLAKSLLEKGYRIKTSTTSPEKLDELEAFGLNASLVFVFEDKIEGNIEKFLRESEILIINIPPKLRSPKRENFVAKIKNVITAIEKSTVNKVLFVSSTSVYGDDENYRVVDEKSPENPDTESGKQILESEKLLQGNKNFQTTILRFGGLIGPGRNLIKFLSGKENVPNAKAPINLIEQKDCIEIIHQIIEKNCWNETFNGVNPNHPSREEYYSKQAVLHGFIAPKFSNETSKGKTVNSKKSEEILGIVYHALA